MSFTNKPSVVLTIDQVLGIVDQLSDANKLKVAKRIRMTQRSKEIDDLIAIFENVQMTEKESTAMVEDVRAKRYARKKALTARR